MEHAAVGSVDVTKIAGSGPWTPVNTGTATDLVIEDPAVGIDIPTGEQVVIEITVVLEDTETNVSGLTFINTAASLYNRGDGDVGAWIWGIGIRRLIDLLRKRKATPVDPAIIAAHGSGATSTQPAADEVVLADGSHGDLADAMRALPADLQAVLGATAIDGLSTKEAAALLGVPQGTVKTRLMRARQQLQEALS